MAVKPIPEGLHSVTPQLAMDGASEAIAFYKSAFGAEEVMRAPDPSGKKIWHAMVRFGNSTLFVNDVFPEMGGKAQTAKLWIYLGGVDAAFQRAVSAGAKVTMPPADMFWGDRMCMVADKWGNEWCIAEHTKDLTPAEIRAAEAKAVAEMSAGKK